MTGIALIGTGLSGLTASLAIAQTGWDVTLIGEAPPAKNDGRTTAILSPGIAYLKKLHLWSSCAASAIPLQTMELVDGGNSFLYDASETDLNEFGFNVPNEILRQVLMKAIASSKNIRWIKQNVARAVRRHSLWDLTLTDAKKISASLVIAADGRNSLMRAAAAIETDARTEDQAALVTIVKAEKPHHYTSVEWYRTGGPLTLVPMEGKNLAVVWCEDEATAQAKKNLSLKQLSREMTEMTSARFGDLTVTAQPQAWPIKPMKARQLVKENVVLIGEAAHVMPPIGAQGFNAGLQDIMALAACLQKARDLGLSPDDPALLRRYESLRLRDIAWRYHGMTRLNDLIRASHPAFALMRGVGLNALRRFAPLKKQVMQFGLGHAPKEDAA